MMKNPFRVLIITCWILLLLCCIAKLFGANWFIAHTNNQAFIDFCNYVQNSFWFYVITIPFNFITCSIYYMAVLSEKKPNWKWVIPLIIYTTVKSIFNTQKILFLILDSVMMIGLPIIINRKVWLKAIISYALTWVFQLISVFLKLNQYQMFDENLFVGFILSIDYIIMLILYYLYSLKFTFKKGDEA